MSHVKKSGQSGGPSRWRVCYQQGLLRLVFNAKGVNLQVVLKTSSITNTQLYLLPNRVIQNIASEITSTGSSITQCLEYWFKLF